MSSPERTTPVSATTTLSTLRTELGETVNRAAFSRQRTTITRNGKALAAIVPVEDLELLAALEDRADREALAQARAEDDGSRITLEEFLGKYPAKHHGA